MAVKMEKTKKKRNKKYNPIKHEDYVSPIEHLGGELRFVEIEIIDKLSTNKFTIKNLIEFGFLIHQLSYIYEQMQPEYDASIIREWVEDSFTNKLAHITNKSELNAVKPNILDIEAEMRDLLIEFFTSTRKMTISITSRTKYAEIHNEAIVCSNIRINLAVKSMQKFMNRKDTEVALEQCRMRLKRNELIKAKKEGKQAYFDDTGDIIIQ